MVTPKVPPINTSKDNLTSQFCRWISIQPERENLLAYVTLYKHIIPVIRKDICVFKPSKAKKKTDNKKKKKKKKKKNREQPFEFSPNEEKVYC
jgi:hypothetical protein